MEVDTSHVVRILHNCSVRIRRGAREVLAKAQRGKKLRRVGVFTEELARFLRFTRFTYLAQDNVLSGLEQKRLG
jgi:hypothetical protein